MVYEALVGDSFSEAIRQTFVALRLSKSIIASSTNALYGHPKILKIISEKPHPIPSTHNVFISRYLEAINAQVQNETEINDEQSLQWNHFS